jgi:F-type H+-transporting ATPase subunit gamma
VDTALETAGRRGGDRAVKREHLLRRRIQALGTLGEAINALKALSAQHLRAARAGLLPARQYRDGIESVLDATGIGQIATPGKRRALLLIASDLGLCDGYNARLAETALGYLNRPEPIVVYCIGRRPLPQLERTGIRITRSYAAAASVAGLMRLLLTLADDLLGDYVAGVFDWLDAIAARFEGVGAFTVGTAQVLPIPARRRTGAPAATPYASPRQLTLTLVREYLYSSFYGLLLDALAAEHGTRLIATESAAQWMQDELRRLERGLSSARRESGTQEVLDIAGAARRRSHGGPHRHGRRAG